MGTSLLLWFQSQPLRCAPGPGSSCPPDPSAPHTHICTSSPAHLLSSRALHVARNWHHHPPAVCPGCHPSSFSFNLPICRATSLLHLCGVVSLLPLSHQATTRPLLHPCSGVAILTLHCKYMSLYPSPPAHWEPWKSNSGHLAESIAPAQDLHKIGAWRMVNMIAISCKNSPLP